MGPTSPAEPADKPDMYGLDRTELASVLAEYDAPRFHADQIYRWLYAYGRHDPHEWTDLPTQLRDQLAGARRIRPGRIATHQEALDGTIKYRKWKFILGFAFGASS